MANFGAATHGYFERWSFKCAGGLTVGTVHVAGLSATMTDALVHQTI